MDVELAERLLGVVVTDPPEQIRAQYRRRLFAVHPDHGGSGVDTRELVTALQVLQTRAVELRNEAVEAAPDPENAPSTVGAVMATEVLRIDRDTIALPYPAEETYLRLLDAAHQIGDVTYVDREYGVLEALLRTRTGTTVSMLVSLQGRANGTTEAFFTLEPIDAVRGDLPSVFDVTELVASFVIAGD